MHLRMGTSRIRCNVGVIIFMAILSIILILFLHVGPYWIYGGQGIWMVCPSTGGCSFYEATDAENAARAMISLALVCAIAAGVGLVLTIKQLHPRSPAIASLTGLAAVLFMAVTVALYAAVIPGSTSYCFWIAISCIFMLISNSYSVYRMFRCKLGDSSRVDSTQPRAYPSRGFIPANQGRNTTTSGLTSQPYGGSPPYPGTNYGNAYPSSPPPNYDNAAYSPDVNYPPPPAYSIHK